MLVYTLYICEHNIIRYYIINAKSMNMQYQAKWMILPNSTFVVIWYIFFSLIIIFYFGLSLMTLTFQLQQAMIAFNTLIFTLIIFILCIIDTVLSWQLITIKQGKLINNRKNNMKAYIKSQLFYCDSIVLIILVVKMILIGFDVSQETLTFIDLIVLLKFYNVYLHQKRLKFYYFRERNLLIFQFFKYMVVLGFLCHVVGCLYFYIDAKMIEIGWYNISDHWLIVSSALNGIYYEPVDIQYLYSFYVSIVTLSTIAYGDITPQNPTQTIFIMSVLFFLLLLYAYIFTQIYEVVTFYNRDQIRIRNQKIKMVNFLDKYQSWINSKLKGRIIAEYEYRSRKIKNTNKEIFFDDLNKRLKSQYNMAMFKLDVSHFMPKFIRRVGLSTQQFNSIITQDFHVNDEPFNSFSNNIYSHADFRSEDRKMFYVGKNKIIRSLRLDQDSIISQYAQQNRWLGLNYFITAQIDFNEIWNVENPIEVLSIKFSNLKKLLKKSPTAYEKYIGEHHEILYWGGTAEDMQKCLLCGRQYHNSLHCVEYRPKISSAALTGKRNNKRNSSFVRKSTPLNSKQLILIQEQGMQKLKSDQGSQVAIEKQKLTGIIEKQKQIKHYLNSQANEAEVIEQFRIITLPKVEINSNRKQSVHDFLELPKSEQEYYLSVSNLRKSNLQIKRQSRFTMARKTFSKLLARRSSLMKYTLQERPDTKNLIESNKYISIEKEIVRISWRSEVPDIDRVWNWQNYFRTGNLDN